MALADCEALSTILHTMAVISEHFLYWKRQLLHTGQLLLMSLRHWLLFQQSLEMVKPSTLEAGGMLLCSKHGRRVTKGLLQNRVAAADMNAPPKAVTGETKPWAGQGTKRLDYTILHQFVEEPSAIPGCPKWTGGS